MTLSEYTDEQLLQIARSALALIPEEGNGCDMQSRNDLRQLIHWLESKIASPTP